LSGGGHLTLLGALLKYPPIVVSETDVQACSGNAGVVVAIDGSSHISPAYF
jgi:hypothetical protein